jgi:lysophospholipase L1-like esterase
VGRFPKLLTGLFRDFRNSYNEGVDKVDAELDLQKKRVDDLITKNPQPSEVVDARGGLPVLGDRLNKVDLSLAEKATRQDLGNKSNLPTTDKTSFEKSITEIFNILLTKLSSNEIKSIIGFADINKNLSKIDETMLSDTLKKQIAGTTQIGSTPPDKSITTEKLAFIAAVCLQSGNMFNKDTITPNTWLDGNNGSVFSLADFFSSEFIPAVQGANYTIQPVVPETRVVFYKSDKSFIKVTDNTATFTAPSGTAFVKVANPNSLLDITKLEIGSQKTPYEPYGAFIQINSVKDYSIPGKKIKKGDIGFEQLSYVPVVGQNSKNLFNKELITSNSYLNYQTGVSFGLANFFVSDFINIKDVTHLVINPFTANLRVTYYDTNKIYLSKYDDNLSIVNPPANAVYLRFASENSLLDVTQLEVGNAATSYSTYGTKVNKESLSGIIKPSPIYTFNDAWTEWLKGNKFPIAFYGDSTVDGTNTTGWVANTIGVDSKNNNAFSKKLEDSLKSATNNSILRVYNAGFSGQNAAWGLANIKSVFANPSVYKDVKMVGIGFGINDRLAYSNEKEFRDGFKNNIRAMIEWFYANNIQPFLVTTQAIMAPGVMTTYAGSYPMRTGEHINSIANEVKKELAKEYQLQLIDMNKFTEHFLTYSSYAAKTIISDRLHFGDLGHKYESDVLFEHICPRTIKTESSIQIDFSNQKIKGVPEDWLTMPDSPADSFKTYVNYSKSDSADTKIMTVWVFVNGKRKLNLRAFRNSSTKTYVKVNGVSTVLTSPETSLGQLELGLSKLEVYTGASTQVDFKGFIID